MYYNNFSNTHIHWLKHHNRLIENKRLILRLKDVLHTTNYCCICYRSDKQLHNLDEDVIIDDWDDDCAPTVTKLLETVFGDKLPCLLSSNSICEICQDKAVDAYIFIQNTICSNNIFIKYLERLESRIDDVSIMMKAAPNNSDFANTVIVINDPPDDKYSEINKQESLAQENMCKYRNFVKYKTEVEKNVQHVQEETVLLSSFVCDYCKKAFVTKQAIACHISKQHMSRKPILKAKPTKKYIRQFECPDCISDDCIHKTYLQSYKKQRLAGQKLIKCPECDYNCYLKPYLIAHVNKMHLKTFNFKCKECGKPLHSKLAYNTHMKNFHSKYHMCQYCERQFMFVKNLDIHREKCKSVLREYKCNSCPFSIDSKEKLSTHEQKHIKSYPCGLCNKILATRGGWKLHKEMHMSNKRIKLKYNYSCYICNKTFSSHRQREIHTKTHDPQDNPKCITCNLQFRTSQEYLKHMHTIKHTKTGARSFERNRLKCDYCDYSVLTETSLEAHINRYHLKIAPYNCSQCDKKFTNPQKLGVHMKTHQTSKTHHCDLCGNYFCGSTALKKHVRLHTGERPCPCEICGERFISNGIKNAHIKRKHSAKTVSCPLCDAMFYSLALMRSHFKKVHWKFKGEKFDVTKVEGLKEQDYDLFRDRRILTF